MSLASTLEGAPSNSFILSKRRDHMVWEVVTVTSHHSLSRPTNQLSDVSQACYPQWRVPESGRETWHCSVMVEIAAKAFLLFKLLGASCPFVWLVSSDQHPLVTFSPSNNDIIIRIYLLISGPFDHAFGHGESSLQNCINGFEDGSREVGIIKIRSKSPTSISNLVYRHYYFFS